MVEWGLLTRYLVLSILLPLGAKPLEARGEVASIIYKVTGCLLDCQHVFNLPRKLRDRLSTNLQRSLVLVQGMVEAICWVS